MAGEAIKKIKIQSARIHHYLLKLIVKAYENTYVTPPLDAPQLFYIDEKIAEKYFRRKFIFDPDKGYLAYKALFEEVFPKEEPEIIFSLLEINNPYGIEIWVDTEDSKKLPLAEDLTLLAASLIVSAAKAKLNEAKSDKKENNYFEYRRQQTILVIDFEYQKLKSEIDELYSSSNEEDEFLKAQFEAIKKKISTFQWLVAAQVAAFFKPDVELSQQDYQACYQLLSEYEQKIHTFNNPEAKAFKRNIFSVNIEELAENKITKANFSFYNRHYFPTYRQIKIMYPALKIEDCKVVGFLTSTATAHTHAPLLPNYAEAHYGSFDQTRPIPVSIEVLTNRFGSPAPSEHIKNKHLATYRAVLNMEQFLQIKRFEIMKALLQEREGQLFDPMIIPVAQQISFELTDMLHEQALNNRQLDKATKENFLKQSIEITGKKLSISLKAYEEILKSNFLAIVDVQANHIHLITPTGVGSRRNEQNRQFKAALRAQYFTWQGEMQDASEGCLMGGTRYTYMCDPLNSARFIATDIDGKWGGNNCAGVVNLYEQLPSLPGLIEKRINLEKYHEQLLYVKNSVKIYIMAVESNPDSQELGDLRKAIKEFDYYEEARRLIPAIYKDVTENFEKIKKAPNIDKDIYLAYSAFLEALNLFQPRYIVLQNSMLPENNGIMQPLINLAAQQSGIFSAAACKSSNDRVMLTSLNDSELAKRISRGAPLDLNNLLKEAQNGYSQHIGHRQTALDGSASPKCGSAILRHVEGGLLNRYVLWEKLAAHKRAGNRKKIDINLLRILRKINHQDQLLFEAWNQSKLCKLVFGSTISSQFKSVLEEPQISIKIKILSDIEGLLGNSRKKDVSKIYESEINDLVDAVSIRRYSLSVESSKKENRQVEHDGLCDFLNTVKNFLATQAHESACSRLKEFNRSLINYIPKDENSLSVHSFDELLNFVFNLKKVARESIVKGTEEPFWVKQICSILLKNINEIDFKTVINLKDPKTVLEVVIGKAINKAAAQQTASTETRSSGFTCNN